MQTTGAHVAGLDVNPLAIRAAQDRSAGPLYARKLEFRIGDIAGTGFADEAFEGAASLDVLLFVPDKVRALAEINRVLKPGASFVGTTFELRAPSPTLSADAFEDYPNAFATAGFALEVYKEAEGWRRHLEEVTAAILNLKAELGAEISPQPLARIIAWAQNRPAELGDSRRVQFRVRKSAKT